MLCDDAWKEKKTTVVLTAAQTLIPVKLAGSAGELAIESLFRGLTAQGPHNGGDIMIQHA